MLEITKHITLNGKSLIDESTVETYSAVISTDDLSNLSMDFNIINQSVRKENKDECRADRDEFEDTAYELQDSLTKEKEE